MTEPTADIRAAAAAVRERTDRVPRLALVLGSGLGELAETLDDPVIIPAADIPGYPASTVQGHQGRLLLGDMECCPVLFVQGRVHMYEGHALDRVTFPVRLAAALGATHVLLTNAAGGINVDFPPGTLMWIDGHIDWTGPRPDLRFEGVERDHYDPAWLDAAGAAAAKAGITVERGVYLWTAGPSYETKAEIRAFRGLGADAVGMSTVPEARAAHNAGMRVLGLSTITNPAAGLNSEPLGHEEVVETGRMVRKTLERLVRLVARGVASV
ncbi:MAG: purine-nucleoside phosphorylase [Rhodothermales bacterium]|nr:purine-nucleoside phosphorylase [Rhodothermales bacterium]MBO6779081.1 purine-nucleoside phosphorylase [Rhodothermales bacterium]